MLTRFTDLTNHSQFSFVYCLVNNRNNMERACVSVRAFQLALSLLNEPLNRSRLDRPLTIVTTHFDERALLRCPLIYKNKQLFSPHQMR